MQFTLKYITVEQLNENPQTYYSAMPMRIATSDKQNCRIIITYYRHNYDW